MAGDAPPWCQTVEEVLDGTDLAVGLTPDQVEERRAQSGFNELEKAPPKSLFLLVLEQFDDTLVKILLLAAAVSFALAYVEEGEGVRAYIEPAVILLILILNAMVGVWQESNAEAALEALKDMQGDTAHVLRDGLVIGQLPSRELVPGDLVMLRSGDKVPADLRMVSQATATLRAEQASLTGESVAVSKVLEPGRDPDCELQSKECMLFAGTAISNGSCVGVVTHIGMATEIGKIQAQIQAAADEEEDTPLKKKLDEFGEMLAKVIAAICLLVWLINYSHFISWRLTPAGFPDPATVSFSLSKCTYYFKIAVALAVAAIPEGLPAVITTCLALGTKKMAARNAIVRRLSSVETLGCTTIICSDKTGTLTTNQMSAVHLVAVGTQSPRVREFSVSGTTYDPAQGRVQDLEGIDPNLTAMARAMVISNEAGLEAAEGGAVHAVGAPTEAALITLAEKLLGGERQGGGSVTPACDAVKAANPCLATLEFDRTRKSMSVLCGDGSDNLLCVKGAAECVLERCTEVMLEGGRVQKLTGPMHKALSQRVEAMAGRALRCLAVAQKTDLGPLSSYDGSPSHPGHATLQDIAGYQAVESSLTFLGLAGLQDPPRPEVAQALKECAKAGVDVAVITGDNKATAEAVGTMIGVFEEGQDLTEVSLTGRDFMALSEEQQVAMLAAPGGKMFSRAEPVHKQAIVRLLRSRLGHVVAMTGDGVNDAPALKLADIGIAMGITGTEVAKEASDMVLADDNFSSIVNAVSEGRSIYNNMKAFIRYMISSNIGEVASIFITAALGLPEGLIPVQLLWVNLVTDGPPATALGFNPPDQDIMEHPPRRSNDPLITAWVFFRYMLVGTYVGVATVAVFVVWYLYDSFLGLDLSADGHTTVSWQQLSKWEACSNVDPTFKPAFYSTAGGGAVTWEQPCDYFSEGKAKASTLSLSVLVTIEMLNALNALSEDNSLLQMPPWCNPYLLLAMAVSFGLHALIMYVPVLADVFSIVPLSVNEWLLVMAFSAPVIVIDEILKAVGRNFVTDVTPAAKIAKKMD